MQLPRPAEIDALVGANARIAHGLARAADPHRDGGAPGQHEARGQRPCLLDDCRQPAGVLLGLGEVGLVLHQRAVPRAAAVDHPLHRGPVGAVAGGDPPTAVERPRLEGRQRRRAGVRFKAVDRVEGLTAMPAAAARVLRHVVLLAFKPETSPAEVAAVEAAFAALPAQIPEIVAFEWGRDVSVEGKAQGFSHCFLVTFADAAGRDAYLPHPAHQRFVELVSRHRDKGLVVDYWAPGSA